MHLRKEDNREIFLLLINEQTQFIHCLIHLLYVWDEEDMLRNGKVLKIATYFFPQFSVWLRDSSFMRPSQAEHAMAKVALSS